MSNNRGLLILAFVFAFLLINISTPAQVPVLAENFELKQPDFGNELIAFISQVKMQNGNDNWTVLVYLDGDNNLEEYAFDDLNSMETIGSTQDVKIIVLVDFWDGTYTPFTGAKCYEVSQDLNQNVINSIELATPLPTEPDMGSPTILRDFIVFGQSYAPADNYLLIIWDHGSGAFGLCEDETSQSQLTIEELEQALSDSQIQHLDIVAFDACLMGQLEVAYEIRNSTDLVVFSEESVPVTGFPYEDILLNLTTFPTSTPKTVASSLVYYYVTAYDIGGRYYDPMNLAVCLSAIECDMLDAVAEALNELAQLLYTSVNDPQLYEAISWARESTQSFSWTEFIDLDSFASALATHLNTNPYFQRATNLSSFIQAAVYEELHLSDVPGAHGLGAVFGTYGSHQLALATDTEWDEFIEAYLNIGASFTEACPLVQYQGPGAILGLHCGYLEGAYDSVYYIYTATETGLHTFTIDAAWTQFETDFDLYIYNAYQGQLAESISSDSSETITINLSEGNTYYIEVYSYPTGDLSAGIFLLQVFTPSSTGPAFPIPPLTMIMLIAGIVVGILVGVITIIIYRRRQTSSTEPPSRYTATTYMPGSAPSTTESTKFCAYCGGAIPSRAHYCPICGSSLD
ncbi:MAG: clostripain-related cysteine peptidase [Promethearchaeota archaeon]